MAIATKALSITKVIYFQGQSTGNTGKHPPRNEGEEFSEDRVKSQANKQQDYEFASPWQGLPSPCSTGTLSHGQQTFP